MRSRARTIALVLSTATVGWLLVQLLHEAGHVFHAALTGVGLASPCA